MPSARTGRLVVSLALLATLPASVPAAEGPEARPSLLTVTAVRPDEQLRGVLALFEGARVPHPAAALAAWKHAQKGKVSLSKAAEAAISLLNPEMVREFRALEGARLTLRVDPATGAIAWKARIPNDDGSLAAVATALALTDGASLEPLGTASVVRLGPPGSVLAASRPGLFALASTRDGLQSSLDPATPSAAPKTPPPGSSGWLTELDPGAVTGLDSLPARRAAAALDALGCRGLMGWARVADDSLQLDLTGRLATLPRPARVEPAWLAPVPEAGVLAVATVALGPGNAGIDVLFRVADRVEKADPAMARVAPVRLRLNLIAAAARVRPEVELWPRLRGLTAVVVADADGEPAGLILGLHTPDAPAATALTGDVVPRLLIGFARGRVPNANDPARPADAPIGTVAGRPVVARVQGETAWIGWGVGLDRLLPAAGPPERSVLARLQPTWGGTPPARAGAVWPGRWSAVAPAGSLMAAALRDAPPGVWVGNDDEAGSHDRLVWPGLRDAVRRGLASLPLELPPDRGNRP